MATRARTAYEDTSVPSVRSQDAIRRVLRSAGADGVEISEVWGEDPRCIVRFLWPVTNGHRVIRIEVAPRPPQPKLRGKGWLITPEQRERQAWRVLAHHIDESLKSADAGLLRVEDIFLAFIEVGPGDHRTVGSVLIPQLQADDSYLALPAAGETS